MKPIEAMVTKEIYELKKGEKVKIVGFEGGRGGGQWAQKGGSAVVVRRNGQVAAVDICYLAVNYEEL